VGDSVVDAQTALHAGYAFVGVLWGMASRSELAAQGARHFAATAQELPAACTSALDELKAP
jgi:phosphoglycolate phosphatase-like HAD superfamily hydrolase